MKTYKNYKKTKKAGNNTLQPTRNIVPKAIARTRADVLTWKNAMAMAENVENPKMFPYYNFGKGYAT